LYCIIACIPFFISHTDNYEHLISFNQSKGFLEILKNNVAVSFNLVMLGIISLGIVGVGILFVNAYFLGETVLVGILKYGPSFFFSIIPHGIFEIPGTILCLVIIWESNTFIFSKLFPKKDKEYSFKAFFLKVKMYFTCAICLIFIGALIEAYITPKLIKEFIL